MYIHGSVDENVITALLKVGSEMTQLEVLEGHTFRSDCLTSSSVVIDLGMNQGNFALGIFNVVGTRVRGLEPVPKLFDLIRTFDFVEDVQPWAITGVNGSTELAIHKDVCASTNQYDDFSEILTVQSVDLERLFQYWNLHWVDLLKIDIEGSEFGLFEAVDDDQLRRVGQITIEFHDFIWPEKKKEVAVITNRLKSLGFQRLSFALNNGDVLFLGPGRHISIAERIRFMTRMKYIPGVGRIMKRTFNRFHQK